MIEFIYKSLSRGTLNTGYKPRDISKVLFKTRAAVFYRV